MLYGRWARESDRGVRNATFENAPGNKGEKTKECYMVEGPGRMCRGVKGTENPTYVVEGPGNPISTFLG